MGSDNVEEEALRRLTMLRVQMLQERVRAEQQGSEQQQHHAMYTQMQHLQQEQMQQQAQAQAHARAQQEQLQRVLEAKRRQLQELDETTQRMREQLARRRAEPGPVESDAAAGGASKLDAILAQTLQMQTMFMAHMASQGAGFGVPGGGLASAHAAPPFQPGAQAAPVAAHPSLPTGSGEHSSGPGAQTRPAVLAVDVTAPPQQVPPLNQLPHHAAAAAGGGHALPEQDMDLLNQLQAMVEKLNRADIDAHGVVEAALERARAQDTSHDAGQSPGKKPRNGQNAEDDEEDDENLIEDGDEILHDDVTTFHDIAFSWLKKAVKPVVVNVLLEADMNLEICAPVKGTFFKKGITQHDIDSRTIKLAVRCRGLVRALRHTSLPPFPLSSFAPSPSRAYHARARAHTQTHTHWQWW
jgi:hypothetical protein